MARLKRVTNKIFGATASTVDDPTYGPEIGQFGSAKLGTYNATDDVAQIQGLSAWNNGWIDAVIPNQQYPTLPEMTGVNKVLSYQTGYIMQEGICEWDSATEYCKGSFVKYVPVTVTYSATASIGDSTGITGASVDVDTFTTQITVDGNYDFEFDGSNWQYNALNVNLVDYGISYTGTPVSGDIITITLSSTETRGNATLYISKIDNNINHNPTSDTTNWEEYGTGANTDLSNLTANGKSKVVTLAHELDYANTSSISTTPSSSYQNYTPTVDGVLFVAAECSGNASANKISGAMICYPDENNKVAGDSFGYPSATNITTSQVHCYYPVTAGLTYKYYANASGFTTSNINVSFVPYKKS